MIKKVLNNTRFSAFILSTALFSLPLSTAYAELDLSLPDYNLPEIGAASVSLISYAKERQIGLKVLREIRSTSTVIEDPEITAWIRSLGNRLSARASNSSNPFYFLVVKNNSINAFATLVGSFNGTDPRDAIRECSRRGSLGEVFLREFSLLWLP